MMWIEFKPMKNKDLLLKVAEGLMKVVQIRIEKAEEGWKLMIKT